LKKGGGAAGRANRFAHNLMFVLTLIKKRIKKQKEGRGGKGAMKAIKKLENLARSQKRRRLKEIKSLCLRWSNKKRRDDKLVHRKLVHEKQPNEQSITGYL